MYKNRGAANEMIGTFRIRIIQSRQKTDIFATLNVIMNMALIFSEKYLHSDAASC